MTKILYYDENTGNYYPKGKETKQIRPSDLKIIAEIPFQFSSKDFLENNVLKTDKARKRFEEETLKHLESDSNPDFAFISDLKIKPTNSFGDLIYSVRAVINSLNYK